MTISVTEGWTGPLDFILQSDGAAQDLTGMTVTLVLTGVDGTIATTTGNVSVTDAAAGKVRYSPDATDLLSAKQPYRGRWKVTDGAGKIVFFPNGEADLWKVWAP